MNAKSIISRRVLANITHQHYRLMVTKSSSAKEILKKKLQEGPDLKDFIEGNVDANFDSEENARKYAEQGI